MNVEEIKIKLNKMINRKVKITEYGLRNKINTYYGSIYKVFPNIFTILINNEQKSFTYGEILTGDIVIDYI